MSADARRVSTLGSFLGVCFLAYLLYKTSDTFDMPESSGHVNGILAINFLFRWLNIVYTLRVLPRIGPAITCLLVSVKSVVNMFIVAVLLFVGFMSFTLLIADAPSGTIAAEDALGKHYWTVVGHLFKALLLGDGDAFNTLNSLGGADSYGIFAAGFSHSATLIFTVIVLNLFMAVYSNEYANNELFKTELFYAERAQVCFESMLQCPWPSQFELSGENREGFLDWFGPLAPYLKSTTLWGCSDSRQQEVHLVFALVLALLFFASNFLAVWLALPYLAAMCLGMAGILVQMYSLRAVWNHPDTGDRLYLWLCFSRGAYLNDDEMTPVQEEVSSLRDEVHELKNLVQSLVQHSLAHDPYRDAVMSMSVESHEDNDEPFGVGSQGPQGDVARPTLHGSERVRPTLSKQYSLDENESMSHAPTTPSRKSQMQRRKPLARLGSL
jgi:hypothetical protein